MKWEHFNTFLVHCKIARREALPYVQYYCTIKDNKIIMRMKKLHACVAWIHQYRIANGLISVLVLLTFFGNALATQTLSKNDSTTSQLSTIDTKFLLRDIQFEAQQSKRDIQRIDDEFRKTLTAVKDTHFTCSALSDVLSERNSFELLVKTNEKLTANSTRSEILVAYQYYARIRGSAEALGVRSQLYGGEKNPATQKQIAGTINELQACRSIATVLNKTCEVYTTTLDASKNMPKESAKLYASAASEIEKQCLNPNEILSKANLTITDVSQQKLAEKLFGSSSVSKKIKRINRKTEIHSKIGNRNTLFTMLESLLE